MAFWVLEAEINMKYMQMAEAAKPKKFRQNLSLATKNNLKYQTRKIFYICKFQ